MFTINKIFNKKLKVLQKYIFSINFKQKINILFFEAFKYWTNNKTFMPQILEFKGFLSFLILHELSKKRLYGEELAEKIGARRGSKLTPGTIYPALERLRNQKLVSRRREGRNKYYKLTTLGEDELQQQYLLFGQYFKGLKSKMSTSRRKK